MKRVDYDGRKESVEYMEERGLTIIQNIRGYRFNCDSILLADFVISRLKSGRMSGGPCRLADAGIGAGIIALILGKSGFFSEIHGFEVQKSLYELAKRNVANNGLENFISVRYQDFVRKKCRSDACYYDFIVCNPPYRSHGSGKMNIDREKRIARHEEKATIQSIGKSLNYLLKPLGHAFIVYPSERLPEIFSALRNIHLAPVTMQPVYHARAQDSDISLLEFIKGGRSRLRLLAPLFLSE